MMITKWAIIRTKNFFLYEVVLLNEVTLFDGILCYVKFQETSTKITVSSISDISSYNLERVITIRGSIPDISRAEAEVSRYCAEMFDLQIMFWIWFFL